MIKETVKYFVEAETYMGHCFVFYATGDGYVTCNESLMMFFPDDYWSWPKR